MRCPQGGDFAAPAGKVVLGRFQEEGQIAQGRAVRHSGERIKADAALADGGVAVLVGAERVLRVVQVDGAQTVEPDDAVERQLCV